MISAKTSNDLFNKVRSKFANIQLGDSMGGVTANPGDAVFFDFEFSENSDEFGRVSISLADGETMKVFYNKGLVEKLEDENKTNWYSFLKELKDFAVEHQIGFDVRDITKPNLSQQDFKNLANNNNTLNTDGMSEELNRITKLAGLEKATVAESLTGTKKSSYENLDKTRLIVRHSKPVESEMPGARTRHINSLYIENADGERFKYPVVHLAGARAMQRHVANGGLPHDEFGEHIIKMSEQIAQLNSFSRYVATKDQLNDSAGDIIEKAKMKLETMRKYVKGLSKQKNYESVKANFQPSTIAEIDDETKNTLKDKFTLKHFDERVDQVLPLINSIMSEYDDEEDAPAVDRAPSIQSFLSDPNKKLILRKDDTKDQFNNQVLKTSEPNTKLSTILSDIGSRLLSHGDEEDTISNFASSMADEIGNEGAPFWKPSLEYVKNKKIAIQLAKRYLDDYNKMQKDPAYKDEVRKDPQDFKKFKNIKGQEYGDKTKEYGKEESIEDAIIEGWADNITEQKPYVSMYKGDDNKMVYDVLDKEGESAFKSDDYKVATDYLKKNFNQLSGQQPTMDDVNENPEANQEMSMDFEFTGDDGETAMGTLYYKVINGKVDPNSLRGESEYEGNARVDDEFATIMVQPGGGDHESALIAAQDDYDYETKRMQSKVGEGNEFAQAVQKAMADDVNENSDEDSYEYDWACEKCGAENRFVMTSQEAEEYIKNWEEDNKDLVADGETGQAALDNLIYDAGAESNLHHGEKCIKCGTIAESTQKEGNEFAQAVQKAKAAGMKPGDKFEVGGKEYTLKDAIEQAGLQLETFFGEDEVEADTQQPAELDHIKKLAGI